MADTQRLFLLWRFRQARAAPGRPGAAQCLLASPVQPRRQARRRFHTDADDRPDIRVLPRPREPGRPDLRRSAVRRSHVDGCRQAAYALAGIIPEEELTEDYIIPQPFDPRVAPAVASEVAKAAMKSGVAKMEVDPLQVIENTKELVKKANR